MRPMSVALRTSVGTFDWLIFNHRLHSGYPALETLLDLGWHFGLVDISSPSTLRFSRRIRPKSVSLELLLDLVWHFGLVDI